MELKGNLDMLSGRAVSISINDFSTLYTLFDHGNLRGNISWLVDRLSKHAGKGFVRMKIGGAYWVSDDTKGETYSKQEILEMVDFLLDNSYIEAFGCCFRQVRGVIMGGKASGFLSDLSLMVDEFRYD